MYTKESGSKSKSARSHEGPRSKKVKYATVGDSKNYNAEVTTSLPVVDMFIYIFCKVDNRMRRSNSLQESGMTTVMAYLVNINKEVGYTRKEKSCKQRGLTRRIVIPTTQFPTARGVLVLKMYNPHRSPEGLTLIGGPAKCFST